MVLKPQRRHYMRQSLGRLAATVKRPCERVVSVDVLADREFARGQIDRLLMFEVVVGVVIDQHAIIEDAVDRVEPRDELDQFALPAGVLLAAHLRIDVAQSGGILGQRNDRYRAAIQAGGFVEPALGRRTWARLASAR